MELAVKSYAEFTQLVGKIVLLTCRIAWDIDRYMGATGAEDTHPTLDIGVDAEFLSTSDGDILRGDIGVEVFVADGNGDVNVVDIEERVGVVGQGTLDIGEETFLTDRLDFKTAGVVGVFLYSTRYVDTECVAILLVIECDDWLVHAPARQGIPFYIAVAANDKAVFMAARMVGVYQYLLDSVAPGDFLFEEPHHGGGGLGKRVAGGGAKNDKLEYTGSVSHQSFARNAVIYRLYTRREVAFGFAVALGVGKFPAVHQMVGGGEAIGGATNTLPGKQMDGDIVLRVVVRVGDGGVVIQVVLTEIAFLNPHPDGVFLGVEYTVYGWHVAPLCIGAELYLAR